LGEKRGENWWIGGGAVRSGFLERDGGFVIFEEEIVF
jgi:hypothetical protein